MFQIQLRNTTSPILINSVKARVRVTSRTVLIGFVKDGYNSRNDTVSLKNASIAAAGKSSFVPRRVLPSPTHLLVMVLKL